MLVWLRFLLCKQQQRRRQSTPLHKSSAATRIRRSFTLLYHIRSPLTYTHTYACYELTLPSQRHRQQLAWQLVSLSLSLQLGVSSARLATIQLYAPRGRWRAACRLYTTCQINSGHANSRPPCGSGAVAAAALPQMTRFFASLSRQRTPNNLDVDG